MGYLFIDADGVIIAFVRPIQTFIDIDAHLKENRWTAFFNNNTVSNTHWEGGEWKFNQAIHDFHDEIFYRETPKKYRFFATIVANLNNKTSGKRLVFFGCFRIKDGIMNIKNGEFG